MILPDCKTWTAGRYTVRQAVRIDNAYWPQYVVMRKGVVVGYSFSLPNADDCASIERFAKTGLYVSESAAPKTYSYRLRGVAATQRGRPTNAARAQAAADLLKIPEGE